MLLQQKTEETIELEKETSVLLGNFQENNSDNLNDHEDGQFIITSETKLLFKRLDNTINSAQISADFVGDAEGFTKLLFYYLPHIKMAMERGVRVRAVIQKAGKNKESILKILETFKKNPLFTVKYTSDNELVCMLLTDSKEINIQISNGPVPSMWSNNRQLIKIVTIYFESLWNKAYGTPSLIETKERIRRKNQKIKKTRDIVSS